MTGSEAIKLQPGDIVYTPEYVDSKGNAQKWRVNGKVKIPKKDCTAFNVPIKRGLRDYGYITVDNCHAFTKAAVSARMEYSVYTAEYTVSMGRYKHSVPYKNDQDAVKAVGSAIRKVFGAEIPVKVFFTRYNPGGKRVSNRWVTNY